MRELKNSRFFMPDNKQLGHGVPLIRRWSDMFTFKEVVGKIYKCPHINHFDKF